MKKKTTLLLCLAMALVLVGAYALYHALGDDLTTDQLAVTPAVTEPAAAPSATEPETVPAAAGPEEATQSEQTEGYVTAPDFTVYDQEGNEVHLSDYFGKPIVLNFWASWCGPCKMELPDFHDAYLAQGESIHFLMVNMTDGSRETVDTASGFIADAGYTFPVLYDRDSDAAMTYGIYSLPTTLFIDAQGRAIAHATGAIDGETLQRGIDMITEQS